MPRKGYWVALADVSDPEGYKLYVAENAKAFRKYHGRFLTRGGQSETPEGTTRSRVVVIEFPGYKAALRFSRNLSNTATPFASQATASPSIRHERSLSAFTASTMSG